MLLPLCRSKFKCNNLRILLIISIFVKYRTRCVGL
nr:MAG TPA: hypothetical protein [Caudoviricetes sp.]